MLSSLGVSACTTDRLFSPIRKRHREARTSHRYDESDFETGAFNEGLRLQLRISIAEPATKYPNISSFRRQHEHGKLWCMRRLIQF